MPKKRIPGVGVRWVSAETEDLYWLDVSGGGSSWTLFWHSDDGEGAELSESLRAELSPESRELKRLLVGVPGVGVRWVWETEREARRALAHLEVGMLAWEGAKPEPEWAIQARAAGWKPPKGWTP
jgi:hypothetical protein